MALIIRSPKEQTRIDYAQNTSKMHFLYQASKVNMKALDLLESITPVAEVHAAPASETHYIGTFPITANKTYRALFRDNKNSRNFLCIKPFAMIGVYAITCKSTGMSYVGSTHDMFKRWSHHLNLLLRNVHTNIWLQGEVQKYGIDDFTFSVVRTYSSTDGLIDHETTECRSRGEENLLNFKLGHTLRKDWHTMMNVGQGRASRPPKNPRGPQTKLRWFDGVRH